jgi:hypothetical protein
MDIRETVLFIAGLLLGGGLALGYHAYTLIKAGPKRKMEKELPWWNDNNQQEYDRILMQLATQEKKIQDGIDKLTSYEVK